MTLIPEKPLAGQTVLVTRPRSLGATPLLDRLNEAGANVILHPVIQIQPPKDWEPLDREIARLSDFGTVVFLSGTGAEYFFARFREKAGPEGLAKCKIAAIGESTAARIQEYGEDVDFVPPHSNSQSMATELIEQNAPGPYLLLRANRGSDVLAKELTQAGKEFVEVTVYESHDVGEVNSDTRELLELEKVDWVTITSSAIARSTATLFGESLKKTKLASISPISSEALTEAGLAANVEATEYNFDGLVRAMASFG